MSLYEDYGIENHLEPVDRDVICQLMEELGGKDLICFMLEEYSAKAQVVFNSLRIQDLTLQNIWHSFQAMLPLMSWEE